jgi:tRNA(Ile)-lysidine synthase
MMADPLLLRFLPGEGILLAGVSGGPDSLCLLDSLHAAGVPLIAAHFNHKLRPEADREAAFVEALAERIGVQFVGGSGDVRTYAEENKLSLEEAARIMRYRFLFAQARSCQAAAVAVGHTADDQVETILMHFLRGAGMTGRTLLPEFDPEIPLVRPIMHLWRNDTEAWCREHALQPVIDPTNTDETYFRNRLRHSLIPELEKYNPRFKNTLLRMAEALAGDAEALTEAINSAWPRVVLEANADHISFRSAALEELSGGLRRDIFRRAIESLRPGLRTLDFKALERASNFVAAGKDSSASNQPPPQVELIAGLVLFREEQAIHLVTPQAELPASQWPLINGVYELQIGGQVRLNANFSLSAVEIDNMEEARSSATENEDPFCAWLDADQTGNHFTIRARRPGDSFSPLGMNRQTVKLREFYINVKIPRRARPGWPLVCAGEQVAWVPGYRLAHPFRITEGTNRAVRLELRPVRKETTNIATDERR